MGWDENALNVSSEENFSQAPGGRVLLSPDEFLELITEIAGACRSALPEEVELPLVAQIAWVLPMIEPGERGNGHAAGIRPFSVGERDGHRIGSIPHLLRGATNLFDARFGDARMAAKREGNGHGRDSQLRRDVAEPDGWCVR